MRMQEQKLDLSGYMAMVILCLNAARSARESNASSVQRCINAISAKFFFAWIVKHLRSALITLIVETGCAANALSVNATNVRKRSVVNVLNTVEVVKRASAISLVVELETGAR